MTSRPPGGSNEKRGSSGDYQRALVTGGRTRASCTSTLTGKIHSWLKMPSRHDMQSGFSSRLRTTVNHPQPYTQPVCDVVRCNFTLFFCSPLNSARPVRALGNAVSPGRTSAADVFMARGTRHSGGCKYCSVFL